MTHSLRFNLLCCFNWQEALHFVVQVCYFWKWISIFALLYKLGERFEFHEEIFRTDKNSFGCWPCYNFDNFIKLHLRFLLRGITPKSKGNNLQVFSFLAQDLVKVVDLNLQISLFKVIFQELSHLLERRANSHRVSGDAHSFEVVQQKSGNGRLVIVFIPINLPVFEVETAYYGGSINETHWFFLS